MASHFAQFLVAFFVFRVLSVSVSVRTFLIFVLLVSVAALLCCGGRRGETRASRRKRGERYSPVKKR